MQIDRARGMLRHIRQFELANADESTVRREVRSGRIRRVHRRWYVATKDWEAARPEERHLLEIIAVSERQRDADVVFASTSAAVIHDLPVFRAPMDHVHIAGAGGDGSAHTPGLVARHRVDIPASDRTERHGLACTSLERTVVDVARLHLIETGIACADAAMRVVAWDDRTRRYNDDAASRFRAALFEVADRMRGARGIRRARAVLAFTDGRADLPAESLTRHYLQVLGFAPPRLQVEVPGPRGQTYAVDFGLDDVDAWLEVDGAGKYTDPRYTKGRSPEQILEAEKLREDWIRGTTGRRVVRVMPTHLHSARTLALRLRAFGVHPQ